MSRSINTNKAMNVIERIQEIIRLAQRETNKIQITAVQIKFKGSLEQVAGAAIPEIFILPKDLLSGEMKDVLGTEFVFNLVLSKKKASIRFAGNEEIQEAVRFVVQAMSGLQKLLPMFESKATATFSWSVTKQGKIAFFLKAQVAEVEEHQLSLTFEKVVHS